MGGTTQEDVLVEKAAINGVLTGLILLSLLGCHVPQRFQPAPEEQQQVEAEVPILLPEEQNSKAEADAAPEANMAPETPVYAPATTTVEVREADIAESPPEADSNTASGWDDIREGMTQAEVEGAIGKPNAEVSRGANSVVYRWDNQTKNATGLGKFEDGKLILWRVRALPRVPVASAPVERVIVEREVVRVPAAPGESVNEAAGVDVPATQPVEEVVPPRPRVVVAGSARRERMAERDAQTEQQGAYQPKARLPEFTYGLEDGSYVFRVRNAGTSLLRLGVRTGKDGKDLSLNAGDSISIRVQRGEYLFYYIFDATPFVLRRTDWIRVNGESAVEQSLRFEEEGYSLDGMVGEAITL